MYPRDALLVQEHPRLLAISNPRKRDTDTDSSPVIVGNRHILRSPQIMLSYLMSVACLQMPLQSCIWPTYRTDQRIEMGRE